MLEQPECSKRKCVHFMGVRNLGESEITQVNYCRAFPNGIPEDIAYGKNKHLKPIEGDNGIVFSKKK